jgi:hypothetical protein
MTIDNVSNTARWVAMRESFRRFSGYVLLARV